MNRGIRTLLVLVVALALAGLAAYGVYRSIQSIPVREVEIAQVHAVVAARAMPAGEMLTADNVKVVPWPAATPLAGGFSRGEDVVGRGLIAAVVENEPITEAKLAQRGSGAGLPPTIPAGMRAVAVKVDEVIGVAGFVVPGSHVDVLATVERQQQDAMTRTFVPNVQVLASGTRYDRAQDGKPIPTTVVTLAVTPQDAERIALAQSAGRVVLALRNPLDVQPVETQGARLSTLLGSVSPPPVERTVKGRKVMVAQSPPPPPAPPVYRVETIKAAKRTEEVVK
jgi:pilus assembly protein CpaB